MKDLVKIDPKEFGLELSQVATIEQAFQPKIQERDALAQIYDQLITSEITPELCVKAGDTRKKLVKVRTGIADIHKTQKAFFLAAGRFVDAWKNKETLPVEQMEENLSGIENHFINIERERKANLATVRMVEVMQFTEFPANLLGEMEEPVYVAYLTGLKVAHQSKIEAEKQAETDRIEAAKKEQLNSDRKAKTIRLVEYIDNYESVNFGEMSEADFMVLVNGAIEKRTTKEAEIEAQRVENDRLKAEAEKQRIKADKEADERAKKEAQQQAELKAERDKAAKKEADLQAQIKANAEAEAQRIADEKAQQQAELSKGDADKVKDLISDLTDLKSKYSFKSAKNQKMYADVGLLLDKVINHVQI